MSIHQGSRGISGVLRVWTELDAMGQWVSDSTEGKISADLGLESISSRNFKIKTTMTGKGSQYPSDVLKRCFKPDPFLQFWTFDLRDCGMAQGIVGSWCLEREALRSFPVEDRNCPSTALHVPSNLGERSQESVLANRTTSSTPDHSMAKSCTTSSMTASIITTGCLLRLPRAARRAHRSSPMRTSRFGSLPTAPECIPTGGLPNPCLP